MTILQTRSLELKRLYPHFDGAISKVALFAQPLAAAAPRSEFGKLLVYECMNSYEQRL